MRPILIVFYTTYTTILAIHRAKVTLERLKISKQTEIEKDEQIAAEKTKKGTTDGRANSDMELEK